MCQRFGHRGVQIVFGQNTGGKGNAPALQCAVHRNARPAAADHKHLRRAVRGLQFQAAEQRVVAAPLHAVQGLDILGHKNFIGGAEAVNMPMGCAKDLVRNLLRQIQFMQRKDHRQLLLTHQLL